jgi:hypothetical protein
LILHGTIGLLSQSENVGGDLVSESVLEVIDLLEIAESLNVLEGVDRNQHRANVGLW